MRTEQFLSHWISVGSCSESSPRRCLSEFLKRHWQNFIRVKLALALVLVLDQASKSPSKIAFHRYRELQKALISLEIAFLSRTRMLLSFSNSLVNHSLNSYLLRARFDCIECQSNAIFSSQDWSDFTNYFFSISVHIEIKPFPCIYKLFEFMMITQGIDE